jgi:hypothetical protein
LTSNVDTGYSAITNYNIYILEGFGAGSYTFLAAAGAVTTFTHSSTTVPSYPVVANHYYSYKVEADNAIGAGSQSTSTIPILASSSP